MVEFILMYFLSIPYGMEWCTYMYKSNMYKTTLYGMGCSMKGYSTA